MPNFGRTEPFVVEVKSGDAVYLCQCGQSGNAPYCDGSHEGSQFTPYAHSADSDGSLYVCGCGKSVNQPFCDGSHQG